jgi:hypothetical protein
MVFSLFFVVVIGGIFSNWRDGFVPFWNKMKKLFDLDSRQNLTTA